MRARFCSEKCRAALSRRKRVPLSRAEAQASRPKLLDALEAGSEAQAIWGRDRGR